MSESDGEQAARSVALEQAYVHEVYEQCAEKTAQGRHWPRIYQFLEELEPGALVCDIGCGNGKYLSVNHSIFKVGVDRCKRFTDIAREKENEVLICDNLALPFRDESFDAVLSIAVVHHFATTERRVHALRELARVLRIGGRLVISVWAMEQRHRKFESQDVLVPWPKAYCEDSWQGGPTSPGMPNISEKTRDYATDKHLSASKRNSQRKRKNKGYWIDPLFSPSPSTSSLSSPNETCYSFFRRALQKLAGRRGSGNRPWFLENWQYGGGKNQRHYDEDETGDVDELPIELRHVENASVASNKQSDSFSVKSKSLGDILEIQRLDLVRSRSSIPRLCSTLTSEFNLDECSTRTSSLSGSKPRLVKQSHFIDDAGLENPNDTANREIIKDLPDCQITPYRNVKRGNVPKQASMNEELMSTDRLEEKERVRRNITKQTSLNEDIICKRRTFEAFRESIYSGNATKKFQLLKSGLTNKIKQSTTNMEKVSSMSIRNGFVKILQGWKLSDADTQVATDTASNDQLGKSKANETEGASQAKKDPENVERRPSKEDGSDSSKDSSLQSDTSVDSEDSFASVIYVPKQQDASSLVNAMSVSGSQLGATSAPPSPRVKHAPDASSSRLKLILISPLFKQFPNASKSLPPPSPPILSPHVFQSVSRPFSSGVQKQQSLGADQNLGAPRNESQSIFGKLFNDVQSRSMDLSNKNEPSKETANERKIEGSRESRRSSIATVKSFDSRRPSLKAVREYRSMSETVDSDEPTVIDDTAPLILTERQVEEIEGKSPLAKMNEETYNEEESRRVRLNQIKELLKQKPGFATRTKPSFPLVRRASSVATGRLEAVTKVLPRLLSLELFNPETDDLDSDSSGVSSPESVGSVISVISDERFVVKKDNAQTSDQAQASSTDVDPKSDNAENPETQRTNEEIKTEVRSLSPRTLELLETSARTVPAEEEMSPVETFNENHSQLPKSTDENTDRKVRDKENYDLPVEDTWSEECRQHLIDFTEKLSENLIHDIDQYCRNAEIESRRLAECSISDINIRRRDKEDILRRNLIPEEEKEEKEEKGENDNISRSEENPTFSTDKIDHSNNYRGNIISSYESVPPRAHSNYESDTWSRTKDFCNEQFNAKRSEERDIKDNSRKGFVPKEREYSLRKSEEKLDSSLDRIEYPEEYQKSVFPLSPYDSVPPKFNHSSSINPDSSGSKKDPYDEQILRNENELEKREDDLPDSDRADLEQEHSSKEAKEANDSASDDAMDFVLVSNTGEFVNDDSSSSAEKSKQLTLETLYLKSGASIDSSDIGDSIENIVSLSDGSQAESTGKLCSGSTVSLISNNNSQDYSRAAAQRQKFQSQRRSASEEIPRKLQSVKTCTECLIATSNEALSGSSSQESLPSDRGGGAITYHQYFHVFREGELDQLINNYVENLHIISSYYDHASWCIVAEKVQVWTI